MFAGLSLICMILKHDQTHGNDLIFGVALFSVIRHTTAGMPFIHAIGLNSTFFSNLYTAFTHTIHTRGIHLHCTMCTWQRIPFIHDSNASKLG